MRTAERISNWIRERVEDAGAEGVVLGMSGGIDSSVVDILPLRDLLKRQVRELARELGIPEEIIAKPPSAGLWEGQTDEGEMGISYDELDSILVAIESGDMEQCDQRASARVRDTMTASQHKRDPIPIYEF
jgi:NAD+ synthase